LPRRGARRYHESLHVPHSADTSMKPSTTLIRTATAVAAGVIGRSGGMRMAGSGLLHPKL